MIIALLLMLISIFAYIAFIFTTIYFKNKNNIKERQEYENQCKEQWKRLYKVLFNKQHIYNCKINFQLIPKCKFCDDKRKVEVMLPDGYTKKVDCSCNKYDYVYNIDDITENINEIFCKNGKVALTYSDEDYRTQYIILTLEEAKQKIEKCNYGRDNLFESFCFTKKLEAEQFLKWYVKNYKKK